MQTNVYNLRQRACLVDLARHCARCGCYVVTSLAFLVTFQKSDGADFDRNSQALESTSGNPLSYSYSQVVITVTGAGSQNLELGFGPASFGTYNGPATTPVTVNMNSNGYTVAHHGGFLWSGNSAAAVSVTGNAPEKKWTMFYRWAGSTTVYNFEAVLPPATLKVTFAASATGTYSSHQHTPFNITLTRGLGFQSVTAAPKNIQKGVLFFDNTTGQGVVVPFGTENVLLNPGQNTFPFNGEVDANGMPKAMPPGMLLSRIVSPSGQVAWVGRLSPAAGGGQTWGPSSPNPATYFDGAGSGLPTIKLPNALTGFSDYVQIPAIFGGGGSGISTMPGGISLGGSGLPAGVTGGVNGALPNGVISGGTAYLPPGVSAGTTAGNPVTGVVGDGIGVVGGGTVTYPVVSSGSGGPIVKPDAETPPVQTPSMAGMEEAGVGKGQQAVKRVSKEVSTTLSQIDTKQAGIVSSNGGKGYAASKWTVPGAALFSGNDTSWMSFSLPIASWNVQISLPTQWFSLIRSVLLWGVKIWFVMAVLKLLMR